ncbi:MAG TPA: hypothetical protein VGI39_35470, partial [Polyangiaceae bacterium]
GAVSGFEGTKMALHAECARWHLGRLKGGNEGRTAVADAERWMGEQGIVTPAKMANAILGGFRR